VTARATIHLAHDWLVGLRGGERVLDRLARLYGPTVIYTLVDDGRHLTEAISRCEIVTSPLRRFPGAPGRLRRWYLPLMPWAVERLRVRDDCGLLISTSSAVMKAIRPPREGSVPHICYCHSPARYIWGQESDYAHGSLGRVRAAGLRIFRKRFQEWDRRTSDRVTKFIANSAHTARKIGEFYGRDAEVIYPPVRTEFFTIDESVPRDDFYLVVSALEPYKRVDLAIEAANRAGFRLRIAGSGTQAKSLRRRAGRTVEMLGRVDDATLRDLYRRARALLHSQQEDFGIIAVEAQASGCPVIAYASGGAVETVRHETGGFFERQNVEALLDAIREFEGRTIDPRACRANAERFAEAGFDRQIEAVVSAVLGGR
jgi:glycosyltransferase involved in cell wall biosynthesis